MQCLAEDGLAGWTPGRVESLRPRLARELERRGVRPAECADAAARAVRALVQTVTDERGRWLLGPHAGARSEYRVRVRAGNTVRSYVMDRVFDDETGMRWIVDYKTSSHEGADVEAFLDRERERYERAARALCLGRRSSAEQRCSDCISRCWRDGASGAVPRTSHKIACPLHALRRAGKVATDGPALAASPRRLRLERIGTLDRMDAVL